MLEIREPADGDREDIAAVLSLSFNGVVRPEDIVLEGTLCAYDAGRTVGTALAVPFGQWFGGRCIPCAGIAGVAVLPEHRGQQVASMLMRELMSARRRQGDVVSALYPANSGLYRQLGYEFAGLMPEFEVRVTDLPRSSGEVHEMRREDLPDVMGCFSRFASHHNGPVQSAQPLRWERHVLAHREEGSHQRTVLARSAEGDVDGYASYFLGRWEQEGYLLNCKHLVALTPVALRTLLGHFRRFENSASRFAWRGAPGTVPESLAMSTTGLSMVPRLRRWMLRVLDVARSLEARGYATSSARAVIDIVDDALPVNSGRWMVEVEDGKGTVTKLGAPATGAENPLPIGLFSALFSGLVTPWDLVLAGALSHDDARLTALSSLFAGPVPWMPDFF
ncbi:MAG TPA: GNAT family N-acetyltransferase [Acidimicrobiales bacterium]|nr:GNAT family N-acetyltransferase [Acidimicrobiales bacterium]